MGERFDSIRSGLEDALAYTGGDTSRGRVWLRYSPAQIRAIRESLGFTQLEFATKLHVAIGTIRNWEQGLRVPNASALVLLRICEREPEAVLRAIA